MRIILASQPIAGHVNPVLAAARILVAAGHDIVMTTGSHFRDVVEASGARFKPLPPGADLDLTDIDTLWPERKALPPGPAQLAFDLKHVFIDPLRAQYAALDALLRETDADLVMADTLFMGLLPLLLRKQRTRAVVAALGIFFLPVARDDGAPALLGLPPAADAADEAKYRAIAAEMQAGLMGPAQAEVNAILADLGAAPLPASLSLVDAVCMLCDLYLQPSVPGFEYPRRAMPPHVRFIGALPAPEGHAMPPGIAAALASGKRIVLVTQGTVANFDLGALIAPTLAAMADRADVLVLATTGGRPVADIPGGVPPNGRAAPFLPFAEVLPKIDVLVTNGGFGTTSQALRHGVPQVVAGDTEDKPECAARIAWSGAGINLRTGTPDARQLRAAIDDVLDKPSFRTAAGRLATEFARIDTPRALSEAVERAVTAARTRAA
jgi:UDP:flavonoid glycosyltransferase YjiC (YdhE family)